MKDRIEHYFDRLWPICRSLTGNGNRESLAILSELVDFNILEVPAGTQCFDWTVPEEWNVREAWIKDSKGNIVVDFKNNNLHLVSYSIPYHGKLSLDELKKNLFSLPEQPDLIPYITSYYKRRWGFCISHNQLNALPEDTYEVYIDASLDAEGSMTLGEAYLKGNSEKEVLFSTYICHPSMANNELSGPLVTSFIYNELKKRNKLKYSYRFIFLPETLGSIYYLSKIGHHLKQNLVAGYVVTTIGDCGKFTYKRSRMGNSLADRAAEIVLKSTEEDYIIEDFFPSGSDERQYCSPGFNLPVGSLMRTRYYKYKEYHTSADNKDFISFEAMEKSVEKYLKIVNLLEINDLYVSNSPYCEPQLGKRGLYPSIGGDKSTAQFVETMMWVLNLADGEYDLIEMAIRSGKNIEDLTAIAENLQRSGLLSMKEF